LVPFSAIGDLRPYRPAPPSPHHVGMVYPEWLEAALASYPTAPDHDHVSAFLLALADLEEVRRIAPISDAAAVLASQLAYDRALLSLSLQIGIDTGPERFEVPERERARLLHAVVDALPALREFISPPEF